MGTLLIVVLALAGPGAPGLVRARGAIIALALALLAMNFLQARRLLRRHADAERGLRATEERLDLAVRGSNDGIWNWTASYGLYLSPRALEVLGRSARIPRSVRALLELVHHRDRAAFAHATKAMFAGAALDIQVRVRGKDGAYRWVHLRGRALQVREDRILRCAGSISDVTERRSAEAAQARDAAQRRQESELAQVALLEKVQGRMGRELHDDLGQQLTGVAFLAKALEQRLGAGSQTERDQTAWIVKLINDVIDRVRFMSRQLSPIALDEITIDAALQRLVDDIHHIFGTRINLQIRGDSAAIPGADANHFLRIAQEAISNALRHGLATRIEVRLDLRRGAVRLAVCDNGHGFAAGDVDPHSGLGLRSMAIRARSLKGKLRIRSSAGGTVLLVRARLAPRAAAQQLAATA